MSDVDQPLGDAESAPVPAEPTSGRGSEDAETVVSGSALLTTARLVGNAGFFVAVLVLTRALSVPHRGQFAFITTSAQVIAVVATFGVTQALIVFVAREPEHRASLLTNALLFTLTSSFSASCIFALSLYAFHQSQPFGLTGFGLALLVVGSVESALATVGSSFLSGTRRWRAQALASAVCPWLYAALMAVLWAIGPLSVERSLVIWVAYYAIWAAWLLASTLKATSFGRPSRVLLRTSLGFGLRAWAGSLTNLLNYRADQVLMGFISTQTALGVYVVAVNASEILLIFPSAAASALLPVLAGSSGAARADRTLRMARILSMCTLAMILLAAATGPFLLPAVFGASYRASVGPYLWLIAGTLGFVIGDVFAMALLAASAPGLSSLMQVGSLVVGFSLDLVLIPSLGATGAAIAAMVSFMAGGLIAFVFYRRRVPFSYRLLLPVRSDFDLTWTVATRLVRSTFRFRRAEARSG